MKSYKLQHYVDKLKRGETFSFARYGDGEMYCMWGKRGGNSNGCRYSPELRAGLLDSMKHKNDPTFIYGMQRVLPQDRTRMENEYPDVDWHDSEFLGEAVASGELYPFIEQLKKMPLTFIANASIRPFVAKEFPGAQFIEVPASNAFDTPPPFLMIDNRVYLFSCGMAANAFISQFHGSGNRWLIDVGHIWDPFVGNMSRCDLEGKTKEDIDKNLWEK